MGMLRRVRMCRCVKMGGFLIVVRWAVRGRVMVARARACARGSRKMTLLPACVVVALGASHAADVPRWGDELQHGQQEHR